MNIYVGNLPFNTGEEDLRQIFAAYGQVDSVAIIKDKMTGRSRGFGFVEMANDAEAQTAIAGLNGTDMGGRTLTVNEARPRTEGGGGGRRSGGGGSHGGGGYGGSRGGGGYGDRRGGGSGGSRRGSGGGGGREDW
jgi:RNA recognition motif-containing protein